MLETVTSYANVMCLYSECDRVTIKGWPSKILDA